MVNVTINKYCHVSLKESESTIFQSIDLGRVEGYTGGMTKSLPLHFGVHKFFETKIGQPIKIKVETLSEAPAGSGLGSSSTIVVALVAAYSKYLHFDFNRFELAEISIDIERNMLKLSGGLQDQYAAVFGGLNFLQFTANREALINKILCSQEFLRSIENNILLIDSGRSRESAEIIQQQIGMAEKKDTSFVKYLEQMREAAFSLKSSILRENFEGFIQIMRQNWSAKKASSASITNDLINKIERDVATVGGLAFKVSGAGGGGFCQVYTKPGERHLLASDLAKLGYNVETVTLINEGVIAWNIS